MASLLVLKGPNPGQRLPLDQDQVILGRNPDCHIVIADHAVSREHAQIIRVNGRYYIEDRDSRNGTFVNNQQITSRTPLRESDRIKICNFLCTFHEGAATSKPLPADLRREQPEPEEPESPSTFEATLGRLSSLQLLESQPAEKLKALLEISGSLGGTLDMNTLLPKISDKLFQIYRQADRCFIILREEPDRLVPKIIKTRRSGSESIARFSKSIVKRCLETTQALLSEDASSDQRFALSQSIADFRIRSVMCAPLCTTEGKAFGVIQVDSQDRTKKFTEDDLKLLVGVTNQAAIALENARLHQDMVARERYQRDLEIAREVQRGFLPRRLPELPGYEFAVHYESAQEVGGDFYDFIPLGQQKLAVFLGDVAGKGVPAALLMAKLSAEGRFCMLTESRPALAVTRLNQLLFQAGLADRFVTLALAVLDPASHAVTLINAGHLTPLIYRHASGALEEGISNQLSGVPLGVVENYEYTANTVELKPGDSVLVFTDGVTDAMNTQNQAFHMKGLRAAIEGPGWSAPQLADRIIKAIRQHSHGRNQHDDIALVCFGRSKS